MDAAAHSPDSPAPSSPVEALSLAVRVWCSRISLDRELAEGANPTTDAARALRARQLSSRRSRRQLASGLRWLVERAGGAATSPWVVAVPLDRRQVSEASELLLALAARIEHTEAPCPRALALASFIVSDPQSPASLLFEDPDDPLRSSGRATTAQLARAALEAIDHRPLR